VTLRGVRTRREARYLCGNARRAVIENPGWFRWEWKIPTGSGVQRHDQLLFLCRGGEEPRVLSLPLKVGRLGHRFGTTDPLRKPLGGLAELLRRLEGLNYDFWEGGRALTAGLPEEWLVGPDRAAPGLPGQVVAAVVCRQFPRMVRELLAEPSLQQACALSGVPLPGAEEFLGDPAYEGPQLLTVRPGSAAVLWQAVFEQATAATIGLSLVERLASALS
ncbi:MAG: hypothetical protein ACKOJF_03635, partial [Planctomycetaceae bacterium]